MESSRSKLGLSIGATWCWDVTNTSVPKAMLTDSYLELEWKGDKRQLCLAPNHRGLKVSGCCSCLWSLWNMYSPHLSAPWPHHKSHCEGQLVQGEVGVPPPHISSPGDDPSSPCHSTNTAERSASQHFGAVFPTYTHRQTLCTWHKQPNLIQTTGWANNSHPAEACKPETRTLQQEMGHASWEGTFKCGLLPSTHWEPRKQISNIHWRSAVLHDYRASQAEVMSELGAVIIPLSLGEIYSGPSEKNETGLCDLICNKLQKKAS